ncbi:CDC48 family AAA ATPase [archaeon]|jgi:transitional endoplasmic reticulum ATPase|nr:CDC48 family AAA ATPase [archaeon]MBT3730398.1 CDC48 family AAA ATPase [archaeon]MBT4670381.1 CDC48 family AAA ATPase [archaeon]MBT5030154.1 CDC48 family AAA ATPase [archaeon]MBT7053150.1 CDC48 family AAA ATPase [archaeon]
MKDVQLKVMEALQEEAYKGIVRIDSSTMRDIGVRVGDIVEIEGTRVTVGIVDRAYPTDIGQTVIRMDGILRRNAKTSIGEIVKVRKAEVKEAQSITIAPAQKGVTVRVDPNMFKRGLLGRSIVKGDLLALGGTKRRKTAMSENPFFDDVFQMFEDDFLGGFGVRGLRFVVADCHPKGAVIISENTQLKVSSKAMEIQEDKISLVTYEDIGGLNEEVTKVREMIELPLKHPELFERLGIEPPKGILLHGPPGCGKTLLAKAVANETDATFLTINGPEVVSKFVGEAEKKIREKFEEAEKKSPAIVFIDEIDAIASKREESYGEVEKRMVAQLLTLLDGLNDRGKVVVIAATNRPNAVDPALRRPGRFDREIHIGGPSKEGRLNILKIHTRNMPLAKDVNLKKWSSITHGFVGADLAALCKEAAINVIRRVLPNINLKENKAISEDILDKLVISQKDFEEGMKLVSPSAMREIFVETPNTSWKDVGGLKNIKQDLIEAVEWPLKHKKKFSELGIRSPKGVLLYGPPGCGKTLLAKAVANESESNFILVKGPELLNKWVGESEKGIREIFKKARQVSPTIIFFDEIDSIAKKRGRGNRDSVTEKMVNTLLTEMDGLEELNDVVVIAATNRPDILDPALLRPGRFDRILLTPLPSEEARKEIFKIHTKNMPLSKDVIISKLTKETENYVGSDIESVCREAGMIALRNDIKASEITMANFEEAVKNSKASIRTEDMKRYKDIEESYIRTARGAEIHTNYFG